MQRQYGQPPSAEDLETRLLQETLAGSYSITPLIGGGFRVRDIVDGPAELVVDGRCTCARFRQLGQCPHVLIVVVRHAAPEMRVWEEYLEENQ